MVRFPKAFVFRKHSENVAKFSGKKVMHSRPLLAFALSYGPYISRPLPDCAYPPVLPLLLLPQTPHLLLPTSSNLELLLPPLSTGLMVLTSFLPAARRNAVQSCVWILVPVVSNPAPSVTNPSSLLLSTFNSYACHMHVYQSPSYSCPLPLSI